MKLVILAMLIFSANVFAKTVQVSDSQLASRIFTAMSASNVLISVVDQQNARVILNDLSCEKDISLYSCRAGDRDLSSMPNEASRTLLRAMLLAGVKPQKNSTESVFVRSISCNRYTENQQGDPDAQPEILELYSCEIEF